MAEKLTGWHIAVAAEAFAAGVFARCGYDVSFNTEQTNPNMT